MNTYLLPRLTPGRHRFVRHLGALSSVLLLMCVSTIVHAQVEKGTCALTKSAKLFKAEAGMGFYSKLEMGQSVALIRQVGTRWEVAAPDGTIGFLDAAWMEKVCTYTAPEQKSSLTADEAKALSATQAAATALSDSGSATKQGSPSRGIGSMALLPIEGERLDPSLVKICANLIASHLAKVPNRTLVTADEIGAMLSLEEQKMALDCSDASCMAEIGGALGVDELVRVSLGKLGSKLIISMSRILVAEASVLGRSTVQIDNVEDYYDRGFQQAVSEIYKLKFPAQAPSGTSAAATSAPTAKPAGAATAPLSVSALDTGASTPWPSYLSMGLGTAAIGAGIYFGLQAKANEDLANSNDIGSQQAIVDAQDQSLMANILYGVGGLGLGTGLYLLFTGDDAAETAALKRQQSRVAMTRFELIPLVNGAMLSLGGTY